MAITPKQAADLKKQADKIQAGLDEGVKKGTIKRAKDTVNEGYDPEASASRISNFNAALNVAINEGRKSRADKTLDFMNGVVPPGALPATSFAGVLSAFNADSAPLESTLIKAASDHAVNAEQIKYETQNSIRDLALKVGENGGSQDVVNSISALVESGDIDAAIKIGATALANGKDDVRQVGSNLVRINDDGEVEVLYSAPKTNSQSPTSQAKWTPTEIKKLEGAGMMDASREEQLRFLGYTAPLPDNIEMEVLTLPAAYQKQFKDDFAYIQSFTQDATPAEIQAFWTDWKAQYDALAPKKETTKKEGADTSSDDFLLGIPSK